MGISLTRDLARTLTRMSGAPSGRDPVVGTVLDDAAAELRPVIGWAMAFGLMITLLAFIGPLYMMNVYERVIPSRNETTLVLLTLVVVFALLVHAFLEATRADMMRRASVRLDRAIAGPCFDAIQRAIVRRPMDATLPSLRDIDTIRDMVASATLTSLLDIVWFPIFLIACYLLHPAFAGLVLATGAIVAALTVLTSRLTSEPMRQAEKAQLLAGRRASAAFQNYEAVQSMGMRPAMRRNWQAVHEAALGWVVVADDRSVLARTLSGFARSLSQTATIGIAAFLVLHKELTPGHIFAVSIIVSRATQPLQQIVAQWKTLVAARAAHARMQAMLRETPAAASRMSLPEPAGELAAAGLVVTPPGKGVAQTILRGVSFRLPAGCVLAVIGPSASGKSSLLRVMLNVWAPFAGEFRLDGTEIRHWNDEELGRHIGFLPQGVELFPGTIAQNIARFTRAGHEAVIDAARRAGAHEMIQQLPEGYDTPVGEQGLGLSGGQRQRIGLARALFGDPAVVILDEPNANLDAAGEDGLMTAIAGLRASGRTVVFVTHKVGLVAAADYVLVLGDGTMKTYGARAEVMQRIARPRVVQVGARAG